MAPPKSAKKQEQNPQSTGSDLPIIHVLAIIGKDEKQPLHIVLQGQSVLGVVKLSPPMRRDHALDQFKMATTRLFRDRRAFTKPVPETETMDLPNVQAVGITRTKDGKYVPLAVRLEGKAVKSYAALFGSALTLNEALSVYKSKAFKLLVMGKTLVE